VLNFLNLIALLKHNSLNITRAYAQFVELRQFAQEQKVEYMFFDNFLALCDSKNVAPTKAVIDAGLPKSSWSYWKKKYEQGEDPKPSSDNASRLAQYFGVTVDYLLTGNQKENPPQQPQSEVDAAVERIRRKLESMPKEQREALMNLIEKM
jgi:transcriptional regulator with XRE-family HTH domain